MMPIGAGTYANMEHNMNRNRDVMMDIRSDVNGEDEASTTANSETSRIRDLPNIASCQLLF